MARCVGLSQVSKMTGVVSKSVASLSMDPEYLRSRANSQRRNNMQARRATTPDHGPLALRPAAHPPARPSRLPTCARVPQ